MQLLHELVTGLSMLHWLSVSVPLAALAATTGVLSSRRTVWLIVVGLLLAVATTQLASIHGPPQGRVAYFGAPLPFARAPIDADGNLAGTPVILRACALADALFWTSAALVLGGILTAIARIGATPDRRPLPRRVA